MKLLCQIIFWNCNAILLPFLPHHIVYFVSLNKRNHLWKFSKYIFATDLFEPEDQLKNHYFLKIIMGVIFFAYCLFLMSFNQTQRSFSEIRQIKKLTALSTASFSPRNKNLRGLFWCFEVLTSCIWLNWSAKCVTFKLSCISTMSPKWSVHYEL